MHRFILLIALAFVACLPQPASAEYAWVAQVRQAASRTAVSIGQCWNRCTDACASTTRGWLRKSVDYLAPTAKQEAARRFGLQLPERLGANDRLVVLIHGLDSSGDYWRDLVPLLEQEGYAVARLKYPNDQPLAESAALLAVEMARLRGSYPGVQADLVAHSMGAIVARVYLEGDDYAGGVEQLILLAPPNHGSCYSRFSVLSDVVEHCALWKTDPEWSWTWMITDGLGEARRDIAPGSQFLAQLNAKARRQNVRYTIVAGNRSCGWRYAGNVLRWSTLCMPRCAWSKPAQDKLQLWATRLESRSGVTDGLVKIENALLPGVDDVVIVPADHTTIACSRSGCPPVGWPIIRERLAR